MVLAFESQSYVEVEGNTYWDTTMDEEYNFLIQNNTWDLIFLPFDQKLVRCKWIYRTNKEVDGVIIKYNDRPVAKEFQQDHGIDYDEIFSPVAKMDSIQLALAIAVERKWEVHHMDVKNAFLHGYLEE